MRVLKHKQNGKFYRLVKQSKTNVNTYIEVDEKNNVIIKKQEWSSRPQEVTAIIIGFDKLIEL